MINRTHSILCLAAVFVVLLAGCATEQPSSAPLSWNNVRPGMQMEQVHALLGTPTQKDLGGAEEIYISAIGAAHSELHVQYDAGGTVCAKRYHYVE